MNGRTRVAIHAALATLAAATALSAVFEGYGWLWPVAGGIAIVGAVSELVRRSPLPAALGPLLAAAAVTCYITALYAGSAAYWHIVPSSESLSILRKTAHTGFSDVRALATPVPTHRGLVLITVVGLAAVALVVDLLAATMRRAALAGLPLLAVFALCTSVAKHGAGWLPFMLASAGFLWLLLADSRDRLSRWGRSLGFDREARPHFTWSDEEVMPSPLSVLGRRIGLTAIVIGVAVPVLIPGLRGGVPKGSGNGLGGGSGSSSVQTINPIVTLRGSLTSAHATPVLRVRSSSASPPYLRLTSLDRFDGTTFSPSPLTAKSSARVSNGIDAPHPVGETVKTTVEVANLGVHWLPLPAQVQSVDVSGDWRYEPAANTVFSSRSDTRDLHYSAVSITPNPTPEELRSVGAPDLSVTRYLALPSDLPIDIRTLTHSVTAKATTPLDRAVAIQKFLTGPDFTYDTHVPGTDSSNALDDFLRVTHKGFCQQFAAAMAVMARIENIPSRVAVGFTRGERQPDGSWVITTHDAHAWPELYFSGYGWLPFEPTPRGDGQTVAPAFTQIDTSTTGTDTTDPQNPTGDNSKNGPAVSKNNRLDTLADGHNTSAPRVTVASRHSTRDRLVWLGLALVACILATPAVVRQVGRRRRWARAVTPVEQAEAAWSELRATAIDARTGWVDGLTPQATARVLQAEAGGLMAAELRSLDRLVAAVQRAWYAADPGSVPAATLRSDVDLLRVALMSDATAPERFVMRAWPRSTMRGAREAVGRVGDLLDSLDLAGARLRARMRPRAAH